MPQNSTEVAQDEGQKEVSETSLRLWMSAWTA